MNPAASSHPAPLLKWYGLTDRGRVRKNNEDSFLGVRFNASEVHHLGRVGNASLESMDCAFAVSDGMGGAKAGEYASQTAVQKITQLMPRAFKQSALGMEAGFADVLTELYGEIHNTLAYLGRSYDECHGMETTLSLCWFSPAWMFFGHIGDSRIYYLARHAEKIKQLSQDDTHVGWLYRNGKISEREARSHPRRNILQKSLGGNNQFVDPQMGAVGYEPGDIFLLCSDGLTEGLFDEQLTEFLRAPAPADADPLTYNPAIRLVKESLERDGRDNTTALVIEVVEGSARRPA